MSYGVVRRTTEIGIRAALGARRADLLQEVIGDGVRVAAAGILLGVFVSLAASRMVSGMLFGKSSGPADLCGRHRHAARVGNSGVLCASPPGREGGADGRPAS